MGHERLGILPKTKKWQVIISEIASSNANEADVRNIACHTLKALGSRYGELAADESIRAAFNFLVGMARAARGEPSSVVITAGTPFSLVLELRKRLDATAGSLEVRELAARAGADAIAIWHRENTGKQGDLFDTSTVGRTWSALGSGSGFCELSRLFFAKLTERYLRYFLEREASALLPDLSAREKFHYQLQRHVGDVSRHSFETSKITQSYAAGWFNKNAIGKAPNVFQTNRFLSYAFSKLREDFRREGD